MQENFGVGMQKLPQSTSRLPGHSLPPPAGSRPNLSSASSIAPSPAFLAGEPHLANPDEFFLVDDVFLDEYLNNLGIYGQARGVAALEAAAAGQVPVSRAPLAMPGGLPLQVGLQAVPGPQAEGGAGPQRPKRARVVGDPGSLAPAAPEEEPADDAGEEAEGAVLGGKGKAAPRRRSQPEAQRRYRERQKNRVALLEEEVALLTSRLTELEAENRRLAKHGPIEALNGSDDDLDLDGERPCTAIAGASSHGDASGIKDGVASEGLRVPPRGAAGRELEASVADYLGKPCVLLDPGMAVKGEPSGVVKEVLAKLSPEELQQRYTEQLGTLDQLLEEGASDEQLMQQMLKVANLCRCLTREAQAERRLENVFETRHQTEMNGILSDDVRVHHEQILATVGLPEELLDKLMMWRSDFLDALDLLFARRQMLLASLVGGAGAARTSATIEKLRLAQDNGVEALQLLKDNMRDQSCTTTAFQRKFLTEVLGVRNACRIAVAAGSKRFDPLAIANVLAFSRQRRMQTSMSGESSQGQSWLPSATAAAKPSA